VSNESRETRAQLRTSSFYATVDGVRLHWTERGAGPGPPLLLLHGLADSQHTWSIVGSRLASGRRVLSLDLPGCGLSDRPDANYTIDWQARLVARWIDGIGIGTFDVLGHSFGGGVALWLLLYVAHSIRKLALIAPGGLGDEVAPLLRLAAVVGVWERGGQWLMGPLTGVLAHRYGHVLTRAERQALHHAPHTERAIASAHRILKKGGRLVILDLLSHRFERARELCADQWLGFSEVQLHQWLEEAGFGKLEVTVVSREKESPHFQTVFATGSK